MVYTRSLRPVFPKYITIEPAIQLIPDITSPRLICYYVIYNQCYVEIHPVSSLYLSENTVHYGEPFDREVNVFTDTIG